MLKDQHHHHHQLVGRRHIHESEYEEIGPPPQKNNNNSSINNNNNNNSFHTNGHVNNNTNSNNGTTTRTPCDLCGTASAMVKCHLCSDQVFCLACDDMYHRHPKRSTHPRKAITEQPAPFRPPLPPKGEAATFSAPVAPPRRNVRKGSTPDSPFNGRQSSTGSFGTGPPPLVPKDGLGSMSRSSTLPRKSGSAMSMVGRPLPPPPPPVTSQTNGRDSNKPDPRLTRSHSMAQQSSSSIAAPSLPNRHIPPAPASVSSFGQDGLGLRKLSTCSQPPMHLQSSYHGQQHTSVGNLRPQPEIPMPGQMSTFPSYPSSNSRVPSYRPQQSQQQSHLQQQQQQQQQQFPLNSQRATSVANSHHSHMGPSRSFQQSYPDIDGPYPSNPNNLRLTSEDPWIQNPSNPYHEEVQFPPQQSFQSRQLGFEQGSQTLSRRSAIPSKNRNRFSKLNKSSSLHDIAHGIAGNGSFMSGEGVTWEDQHWSGTQSSFQQPTMTMAEMMAQQNGNFKRATSTKSLHQLADPWNGSVWNNGDQFGITQPSAQSFGQPVRPTFNPMMNRWMAGHPMFNPMSMGNASNGNFHRSMHELNFGGGSGSIHHPNSPGSSQKSSRSKKSGRRSSERKQPSSSSKSNRRSGTDSRSQSQSSRRRHQRRSETSEEEDLDEVSSEEEEDEDFFTGESDNDFVSLSSGSNSRRAPRKSWICEHCTYMNNPGVTVCTVCCRTSKMSRGDDELTSDKIINSDEKQSKSSNGKGSSSNSKYRNRKKYNSSDEESEEAPKINRKKSAGNSNSKSSSLKRRGGTKGKTASKSPLPKSPENTSDLEQDAINTYYAVRMDSKNGGSMGNDGRYESSSEASNANNPMKRPNFEAPAPAKGILKKSNSNPQLTKLELEAKSDLSHLSKKLEKQMLPSGPGKVVDIKKYLAQTQDNPKVALKNGRDFGSGDIWKEEQANWMRQSDEVTTSWKVTKPLRDDDSPARSTTANAPENDYMSDVASQSSRMYRTVSGQSLGDLESHQQEQSRQNQRRTSDVGGKKNFRSKRFSRNLERDVKDPSARRSHSLHIERTKDDDRDHWVEMHSGLIKKVTQRQSNNSESSSEEAPIHFTATVEGETRGPGGIGSYLARQEFGSNEGPPANGAADSGYVSHSSGGHYPRLELPTQAPIEAFTMSVDRGYLGRAPGDNNPNMYRSMDDLTAQKATGLELVRLLRDAEQSGYTAEDIQVSLNHCGDVNPVSWLRENWDNMMDTVVTLASNVGHEAEENTIGTLSKIEAKEALRKHKGNIWAAVTECVEQRQMKYDELCSKGNFSREDIVTVLTAHQGNVEAAFQELNKATLKPFLMRIWGQAEPGEVASGSAVPREKEEVEATIILTDTGAKKKLSSDATALNLNVEASATIVNGYQPGNLLKNIDVPQQQQQQQAEPTEEDLEKFKFDRQVRRLLAEGRIPSYEKGELVVKLQEMEFAEEEALVAAENCDDIYTATKFLRQECELCANVMNVTEIISMPSCEHKCCKECASKHFTIVIKDRTISEARCPFCHEPSGLADPDEDDLATAYFAKLDILLKSLIDQDVHDLFQRKLRDRTLMKDPNFKWCYKCSSGFIADPRNKKLVCPDCRAISCAKCLKPWEVQHEGITCEEFAAWKEANDPDNQAKGLELHMEENGIECPACKFKYALTKGGCMHFTCSQCKHEFCIGCNKPFKLGVKCGKGPGCAKMGLHSHHPRNCLFYLRDKEPADLQRLLKNANIEFMTEVPGEEDDGKCRVQIQRELGDGVMKDDACGDEAPKGFAGYCKTHYVEYLCGLVFRHSVEPVSLLDLGELQQVFNRANHFMPRQRPGEYEYQYKKRLSQVIQNEIPLETA